MGEYLKDKDPIYLKIKKNNDYVIFYSEWCHWSMKAVKLLDNRKVKCKGYIIDKIDGYLCNFGITNTDCKWHEQSQRNLLTEFHVFLTKFNAFNLLFYDI